MIYAIATEPASEPVTLAEAKAHLRLEHDLDDAYIGTLIKAAREHAEKVCRRGFVSQTWTLTRSSFPAGEALPLARGTLASVESVEYVDASGTTQTMSTDDYDADTKSVPGRVVLRYGKSWPSARYQWNAVTVTFVVGTDAASVPAPVKHALLLLVSQMYEHRTPEITGTIVSAVSFAVDALLDPFRLVRF